MDDLIKEFISETNEGLSELDVDLVNLENNPDDVELLSKIFRLMHTIKGTCGFIGLPRLEKTAHVAENLLDHLRNKDIQVNADIMTLLFTAIDHVRLLVEAIELDGKEPEGDDQGLIQKIEKGIERALAGSPEIEEVQQEEIEDLDDQNLLDNDEFIKNDRDEGKKEIAEKASPVTATQNLPDQGAKVEKTPEFLRVQMGVLENLINMVSELVLTRNQLLQIIDYDEDNEVNAPLQRLNRIVSDLQEGVMKTRMQPIGNAWAKLPRIVRDLSVDMGKKIKLTMTGEETELDRQVLEMIKDPLTHMIRNSCDHGIEMPEARMKAGKAEEGLIRLNAYHEGGFIIIEVHDDGGGLDPDIIGRKAVEKGLIEEDKLGSLSEKQILYTLFKAGFSTAKNVTNVSGRGVGMDVVKTNIEKIGGTIDMDSTLGQGTSFKIQIPLTLAIISALIVEIDKTRYAIPQLNIQELVRVHVKDNDRIEYIKDRPVFRLRDKILPLIDSTNLFDDYIPNDQEADDAQHGYSHHIDQNNIENKLIAVINAGSCHFGLIIDDIYDMEEIVIKSISPILQNTKIFAGNTILGDGDVIMILDPASIARHFDLGNDLQSIKDSQEQFTIEQSERLKESASMLVFKAGEGTPFAIPLPLISRLQQIDIHDVSESGDEIIAKHNGKLLPLYFIADEGQKLDRDIVTTLVISDDVSEAAIGLIIENVIDIVEDKLDLSTSTARGGVIGSVTLNGNIVDVVDIAYYLEKTKEDFFSVDQHQQAPFVDAAAQSAGAVTNQKSVLVVDDSPFFRNMLKPILTAAGYVVTVSEDAIEALKLHDQGSMFDIILSDIEMPHMTGYEFIEKIRSDTAWRDLPCIALTSHTTNEDIEYGYQKGFTKYIGKFDKDELTRTLKSVITDQ